MPARGRGFGEPVDYPPCLECKRCVLPNSAAKAHAEKRFEHEPTKVVDSGIRGRS